MTSTAQTNSDPTPVPHGEQALIATVGGPRYFADWTRPDHRLRRLLSEFIGVSGLTFVLSGGAAILVLYGGGPVRAWEAAFVLSTVSALWLVAAVLPGRYFRTLQSGYDLRLRAAWRHGVANGLRVFCCSIGGRGSWFTAGKGIVRR